MNLLIRPATVDDVPAILPMAGALCAMHAEWQPDRFDFLPDIVDRYRQWLPQRATDPSSVLQVAEQSGRLVGFSVATVMPTTPIYLTQRVGWIHDLWVEPAQRGKGVGEGLVRATLERFRERGIVCVRLETAIPNEPVRRMFRRMGFRESVIEMQIHLEGPEREHPR